jgi:hypothetical protein
VESFSGILNGICLPKNYFAFTVLLFNLWYVPKAYFYCTEKQLNRFRASFKMQKNFLDEKVERQPKKNNLDKQVHFCCYFMTFWIGLTLVSNCISIKITT